MSSAQCLRRLAAAPQARPVSLRRLYATTPRSIAQLSSASKVSCGTAQISNRLISNQRKPAFLAQSRQFSLSSRYNEEQRVKTPQMAESITEGTLKSWNKSVGDYVEQDEELGSIETDKIDVAINSPAAGTIKEFLVNPEDTVEVGQDILVLTLGGEPGQKSESKEEKPQESEQKSESKQDSKSAQPAEENKEVEQPKQKEVDKAPSQAPPKQEKAPQKQESKPSQPKKAESSSESHSAPASPYGNREERRVKMNRMRLRIAERLKQSQNTAASLTTFNEVDMSSLMNMRKAYKDEILKKTGVKFGFMGAFAMASVLAMKAVPSVNASIEGPGGGDTIVYRDYVDISVAVATEKGLVTPVVRNAESLDIVGIEKAISELGKKARDNKLTIEDMAGGTFTISNGGVFGSLMGTPIINLPQTAVLGLHAIKDKPMAIDGKVEIRPMMYLALTYDHRLLDGREAVTFLVKIKEYIEDPRKMLLAMA